MEEPGIGWVGQLCRHSVGSRKMLPGQSFLATVANVDHVGLNYEICCRRRGRAQVRGWKPHLQDCLLLNEGLYTNQLVTVELICWLCQASANDHSSALVTEPRKKKSIFFLAVSPFGTHSILMNSTLSSCHRSIQFQTHEPFMKVFLTVWLKSSSGFCSALNSRIMFVMMPCWKNVISLIIKELAGHLFVIVILILR